MLLNMHTAISNMKALIYVTFHGASKERIQEYLDKYCFEFNRKLFHENLFERLTTALFFVTFFAW